MHVNWKPVFISIFLIALLPVNALAASFEYLYLEASEGNSSGGHSAIQFGDEIYHFQHHDSGLIRLLKQDKQEFHFLYRFLQNRRIHISQIEVSEASFKQLGDYFKLQFLAQNRQFEQLDDLHKDRILLRRLLYKLSSNEAFLDADFSSVLRLDAVGLFYNDQQLAGKKKDGHITNINGVRLQSSQLIKMLHKKIEQHYGQDYLKNRRDQITTRIKVLAPEPWPTAPAILSKDNFPPVMPSFAESYTDYLTGLVAIKVLEEEQSLQPDAFFITPESVTPEEKKVLENLRDQLALSLLKSVDSGRSDWGYAVLVNLARFIAVDQSLQSGVWVFIDDFATESAWLGADQFSQHVEQIYIQINDAQNNLIQTRKTMLTSGDMTETGYSMLEMSANRYFELLKGKQQKPVRYLGEKALPTKSVGLPDWLVPGLTQQQLITALTEQDKYENKLLQELAAHYRYDLITRNCVTQLFGTIDLALLAQNKMDVDQAKKVEWLSNESTKQLGGDVSAFYNFIPFMSFKSVQEHYRVTNSTVFSSYRDQQLATLYTQNAGLMVALRESNIFSSTLYVYNPDDAFFVFFTDDNVAFRPVFGLFNTVAGIGQSLFGFLSWPFDSGQNLKSGATGVLMSLPELLFFNMRKGSYQYLSYNQFVHDENWGD
ncbi:hypothetical protein [Methylobacter sp. S3L5C]|uniref:hypothetical protein n=1 Tax=Methylobacter sp. S3L5C TaxID=2839024 RepID=UPI001FAD884E|nr:hypothetical protein [Methylobacter sp. S3L5C]UOA09729.1 hypothetical protein KKZ03_05470 [Methylobacter sp. S3L5C]